MFFKVKASIAVLMLGAATCSVSHAQESRQKYLVYLNPFAVQQQEVQTPAQGAAAAQAPVMLNEQEKSRYLARNWEKHKTSPAVEKVKESVLKLISSAKRSSVQQASSNGAETSALIPAFYAYLDKNDVEVIRNSGYAVSVDPVDAGGTKAVFSSYYDNTVGGEIIPWGKQAVNANDGLSAASRFYLVDSHFDKTNLSNEINLFYTSSTPYDFGSTHAPFVISIATAKANSALIRGINPGQAIVHFGSNLTDTSIVDSIHNAAAFSEWNNEFSTLNLSINSTATSQSKNKFNHDSLYGRAIRRASGRLFVTQSAGNFDMNACVSAFNYGSSYEYNDGVMVVGGTNRFGQRYSSTTNPAPWDPVVKASNYGPCIEAWAPADQMTSTLENGSLSTATGTSFSAPTVAALAGRYGDHSTRPLEREAYIRNSLSHTGSYEGAPGSNLPIQLARYTPPSQHNIPRRLPVAAVYSQTHTANLDRLVDGKFYDSVFWSAGANWGSVVIDLGSVRGLTGIRMMIRSSADGGQINFAVHGGNSLSAGGTTIPDNPIAYKTIHDQYDLIPYYIPISGNHRYVMLQGHNFNSWLAYSEIEVYGR